MKSRRLSTFSESFQASDSTTDNQRVDILGSFVCVHSFQINCMPKNVVVLADAVTAMHVSGLPCDSESLNARVSLYHRNHFHCELTFLLEP